MRQHIGGRIAVLAALLLACTSLTIGQGTPAAAAPKGSPWGANYFPDVPLLTQDAETVRFYDDLLKGKAVAINLIYTHCKDRCPLETARLVLAQKLLADRMGKDLFFYSISIDPERDTPEVLKAYMAKFHVGPGWTFLTGKKADIDLISKKLGLYSLTDIDNPDGHLPSLMLGNEPTGQWMRNSALENPRFLAVTINNFLGRRRTPGAGGGRSYAEATQLPMPKQGRHLFAGQYLFQTRCSACHSLGHGDKIGPDLLGVTGRRDRAWLARFIQKPDELLAAGDPTARALFEQYQQVRMPNLRLGPGDVAALIRFLEAQTTAQEGAAGREAAAR
ncbi:MAG TPA: SCO family protein [Longimicrobiales bacterium]|nr:SCO family protein [Longimicrobiales bacterium]